VQQLHADALPHFYKQPSATSFPAEYVLEIMARPDTVMLLAEQEGRAVAYLYADVTAAMESFAYFRSFIFSITVLP
jgi:hypothetical protein